MRITLLLLFAGVTVAQTGEGCSFQLESHFGELMRLETVVQR